MLLGMAHGDDVIEADLQLAGARAEADELRAVRSVDVVYYSRFPLRHAVEIELELDPLLVHRRGFQLVVVVARNRAVRFRIHGNPPCRSTSRSMPDRCGTLCPGSASNEHARIPFRRRPAADPDHLLPL